jgi:hypothetical protein
MPAAASHLARRREVRPQCAHDNILETLVPQWASPQRTHDDGLDLSREYSGPPFVEGYEDDVLEEVEGVVVGTHIAAIDNVLNHTHGNQFDTELIGPAQSCNVPYEHALNDKFPGVTTGPDARLAFTLPLNAGDFSFALPDGTQYTPSFASAAGTSLLYETSRPSRDLSVCFQLQGLKNHDEIDPSEFAICDDLSNADSNKQQELAIFMTVNGQTKLYSESDEKCLPVTVFSGDTLAIGSHGFECDFSCGEHWGDPEFANASDDRIGWTSAAFTEQQNWGVQGGGTGSPGTYVLVSQPDLATVRSRTGTQADYKMTVTIQDASH